MKLNYNWAKKHRVAATIIVLLLMPAQCLWITAWKICAWFELHNFFNMICDLWKSEKGQNG